MLHLGYNPYELKKAPLEPNEDEPNSSKTIEPNLKTNDNYQIIHNNGQRIYCPASSLNSPRPPRGTEVFVGNLPRNLMENELLPVFSQVGPIYKLRLMMDFTGTTRGFAFISYFTATDASKAVLRFNDYHIRR